MTHRNLIFPFCFILLITLAGCSGSSDEPHETGDLFRVLEGQRVQKVSDTASINHIYLSEDNEHWVQVLSGSVSVIVTGTTNDFL